MDIDDIDEKYGPMDLDIIPADWDDPDDLPLTLVHQWDKDTRNNIRECIEDVCKAIMYCELLQPGLAWSRTLSLWNQPEFLYQIHRTFKHMILLFDTMTRLVAQKDNLAGLLHIDDAELPCIEAHIPNESWSKNYPMNTTSMRFRWADEFSFRTDDLIRALSDFLNQIAPKQPDALKEAPILLIAASGKANAKQKTFNVYRSVIEIWQGTATCLRPYYACTMSEYEKAGLLKDEHDFNRPLTSHIYRPNDFRFYPPDINKAFDGFRDPPFNPDAQQWNRMAELRHCDPRTYMHNWAYVIGLPEDPKPFHTTSGSLSRSWIPSQVSPDVESLIHEFAFTGNSDLDRSFPGKTLENIEVKDIYSDTQALVDELLLVRQSVNISIHDRSFQRVYSLIKTDQVPLRRGWPNPLVYRDTDEAILHCISRFKATDPRRLSCVSLHVFRILPLIQDNKLVNKFDFFEIFSALGPAKELQLHLMNPEADIKALSLMTNTYSGVSDRLDHVVAIVLNHDEPLPIWLRSNQTPWGPSVLTESDDLDAWKRFGLRYRRQVTRYKSLGKKGLWYDFFPRRK